jgi:hypothetical protein
MFHLPTAQARGTDRFRTGPAPLRVVRFAYYLQADFGRKRAIEPGTGETTALWTELRTGTWIDPVLSPLAGYEMLRRGGDNLRPELQLIVNALRASFPQIADAAALAACAGEAPSPPPAPPLFRDGLLAIDGWDDRLPLPARALDFNHIFTAWRAAP